MYYLLLAEWGIQLLLMMSVIGTASNQTESGCSLDSITDGDIILIAKYTFPRLLDSTEAGTDISEVGWNRHKVAVCQTEAVVAQIV